MARMTGTTVQLGDEFYTTNIMTNAFLHVILGIGINQDHSPERKGNATETYEQLQNFKSPV